MLPIQLVDLADKLESWLVDIPQAMIHLALYNCI
jgi:hypothetical protein